MKIALVSQPFDRVTLSNPNSIAVISLNLARELASIGHDVVLVAPNLNGLDGALRLHAFTIAYVPLKRDPLSDLTPDGPSAGSRDGVPAFMSDDFAGDYFRGVASIVKAFRPHMVQVYNFVHLGEILRDAGCATIVGVHMQCQWLTGLPAAFVRRKVAALDRVTFASKYLLDEFVRAFPELQPKTATIHNGVDVSLFRPDETRVVTSDGITRVLFVGRVSPEKGVHCLLQAWGRLGAESHRMSLRIVGPFGVQPPAFFIGEWSPQEPPVDIALFNDNVYLRYLDDLRRTSGSNIEVIGNMPHRRLPRVYQQSDVFVFPSVWPEPFGLPLVEASATGLGIVALGGGSVSEIISDGHSGIVVAGNDDQALCEAIRQLADDGELRKKFGLEARARMESAFTWRHVARDMIDKLG